MDSKNFDQSVEEGHKRSTMILKIKEQEYYVPGGNRLQQFYDGADETTNPCEVLLGFAKKHWTSLCSMAKNPDNIDLKMWREKITDLRNYTHLLDALIEDGGMHK